jgi:hypothetical protein
VHGSASLRGALHALRSTAKSYPVFSFVGKQDVYLEFVFGDRVSDNGDASTMCPFAVTKVTSACPQRLISRHLLILQEHKTEVLKSAGKLGAWDDAVQLKGAGVNAKVYTIMF